MAPKRGQSIERTEAYEEFMKKLAEYHERRGTSLDPEPKVGLRHISLHTLYDRVIGEGGYDLCSDTKAKPLMWRKFAEEFVGKNQYTPAQAFQIKSIYYKNLCAYEISEYWKKEPPPKEILEEVTAKGGNVMGRTVENFVKPLTKEERNLQRDDDEDAEGSPEQTRTPVEDKKEDIEDPGSAAGGRSTRGLRQQPPQRVLFQPDLNPARQTRGQTNPTGTSPAPGSGINGFAYSSSFTNGTNSTLASYEPSQSYPLSLKPVITPANNPEHYRNERKRKLADAAGPLAKKYRNIMLPGTGFIGPNIYVRAQLALQSGIVAEEQYALHHLVKISHERGDKYQFNQFPGLAEALVRKAMRVSELFYDVQWDVCYDDEEFSEDDEQLDGLHGTSNIIEKLRSRIPLVIAESVQDAKWQSELGRHTEAALIVRNMAMLDANAAYMAKEAITRDYLAIILGLPHHPCITELRNYALETAEQVLKWTDLSGDDALYLALIDQLRLSKDKGTIALCLRIVARIAMNLAEAKKLEDIPTEVLQRCDEWLMVEDEELRSACLDFLMQYTSFSANVLDLISSVNISALTRQLSRLLLFDGKEHRSQNRPAPRKDGQPDEMPSVPRLSRTIVTSLLKLDEPERSSEWLRMCFLADPGSEMTQISLWQAYQGTFAPYHTSHPHLIAGDFIKNVSTTFTGATAQVAGAGKYVIRGIRARKVPVDSLLAGPKAESKGSTNPSASELHKCCWHMDIRVDGPADPLSGVRASNERTVECGEWFRNGEAMLGHILSTHLRIPTRPARPDSNAGDRMDIDAKPSTPNGISPALENTSAIWKEQSPSDFDFAAAPSGPYKCRWADCRRSSDDMPHATEQLPASALFARHVRTHLPDAHPDHVKHSLKPDAIKDKPPAGGEVVTWSTLEDEKRDLAGIPLGAALVLRNLARGLPPQQVASAPDQGHIHTPGRPERELGVRSDDVADSKLGGGLVGEVFGAECRERMFFAMSHHSGMMKDYIGSILRYIRRVEEGR